MRSLPWLPAESARAIRSLAEREAEGFLLTTPVVPSVRIRVLPCPRCGENALGAKRHIETIVTQKHMEMIRFSDVRVVLDGDREADQDDAVVLNMVGCERLTINAFIMIGYAQEHGGRCTSGALSTRAATSTRLGRLANARGLSSLIPLVNASERWFDAVVRSDRPDAAEYGRERATVGRLRTVPSSTGLNRFAGLGRSTIPSADDWREGVERYRERLVSHFLTPHGCSDERLSRINDAYLSMRNERVREHLTTVAQNFPPGPRAASIWSPWALQHPRQG